MGLRLSLSFQFVSVCPNPFENMVSKTSFIVEVWSDESRIKWNDYFPEFETLLLLMNPKILSCFKSLLDRLIGDETINDY